MGRLIDTDNVYMQARLRAAEFNDDLKSREGASKILGVSHSSLINYETDVCKRIPPDVVVMMAELYNAPELMNYYCCNECPIGKRIAPHIEIQDISDLTIQLALSLKHSDSVAYQLMEIVKDRIVSKNEKLMFKNIIKTLDNISENTQSLKLWAKKHSE